MISGACHGVEWSAAELAALAAGLARGASYAEIARELPGRTQVAIRLRACRDRRRAARAAARVLSRLMELAGVAGDAAPVGAADVVGSGCPVVQVAAPAAPPAAAPVPCGPGLVEPRGHTAKIQALRELRGKLAASIVAMRAMGRKILVLSDTHGHLMLPHAIERAVTAEMDATDVVLCGDLLDLYSASYFAKRGPVALQAEWDLVLALLDALAARPWRIHLVAGNHEARFPRLLREALSRCPDTLAIVDDRLSVLDLVARGYGWAPDGTFAVVRDWGGRVLAPPTTIAEGAVIVIGDLACCHVDRYLGGGPLRTVAAVSVDLVRRHGIPHRACVQGHTHALGSAWLADRVWLAESGCLCSEPEYANDRHLRYAHQTTGYAVVEQDADGRTILSRCRTVRIGGDA